MRSARGFWRLLPAFLLGAAGVLSSDTAFFVARVTADLTADVGVFLAAGFFAGAGFFAAADAFAAADVSAGLFGAVLVAAGASALGASGVAGAAPAGDCPAELARRERVTAGAGVEMGSGVDDEVG